MASWSRRAVVASIQRRPVEVGHRAGSPGSSPTARSADVVGDAVARATRHKLAPQCQDIPRTAAARDYTDAGGSPEPGRGQGCPPPTADVSASPRYDGRPTSGARTGATPPTQPAHTRRPPPQELNSRPVPAIDISATTLRRWPPSGAGDRSSWPVPRSERGPSAVSGGPSPRSWSAIWVCWQPDCWASPRFPV